MKGWDRWGYCVKKEEKGRGIIIVAITVGCGVHGSKPELAVS